MAEAQKSLESVKWNTRQRLQYIELMAFYTGVVTRSDVANTFGISDAAATKDLKLYGQLAPDNLIYKHNVFGFVPNTGFREVVTDLSPELVLPIIAGNLPHAGNPDRDKLVYGVPVDSLPLPTRLPDKHILAQILRATRHHKKLELSYHSLSDRESDNQRIIEPHSLINTGLRWHIRAYSEESFDFRDYVLSRITEARMLEVEGESSMKYDDDWVETISLEFTPHPGLSDAKREILMLDYNASNGIIRLNVKRALIGYVLQRLSVDTTTDHSLNPNAYQLVLMNRDEIEPFAGWALHQR